MLVAVVVPKAADRFGFAAARSCAKDDPNVVSYLVREGA